MGASCAVTIKPEIPREMIVPSGQTRILSKVKGDTASMKLVKFPVIEKGEHNSHFIKGLKRKTQGNEIGDPVSLTSIPGKTVEQILLETMLRCMEGREVIGDS